MTEELKFASRVKKKKLVVCKKSGSSSAGGVKLQVSEVKSKLKKKGDGGNSAGTGADGPKPRPRPRPVCVTEYPNREGDIDVEELLGIPIIWQDRLFTTGQFLLCLTCLLYTAGFSTAEWVCREYNATSERPSSPFKHSHPPTKPGLEPLTAYGIWKACDRLGQCERVWEKVEGIGAPTVLVVQCMATAAFLGYGLCVVMEFASNVRIFGNIFAVNRATELLIGLTAVIHFMALLIFTGEIKNRARRMRETHDVGCWGFSMMAASNVLAVLSLVMMALFRRLPRWRRPRRHWQLPHNMAESYTLN